eukprot:scaffold13_cov377-Prasinococcus_capsulatus_cf.AAC.17
MRRARPGRVWAGDRARLRFREPRAEEGGLGNPSCRKAVPTRSSPKACTELCRATDIPRATLSVGAVGPCSPPAWRPRARLLSPLVRLATDGRRRCCEQAPVLLLRAATAGLTGAEANGWDGMDVAREGSGGRRAARGDVGAGPATHFMYGHEI